MRNISFWFFCALFGLLLFMALIGPWGSPYTYAGIHLEMKNMPPCSQFWFGTDELGRDIFTRVWWGVRISLFIGFAAALIDTFIGVVFGAISAYFGGKVDACMMRFADVLYGIPYLLIVILFTVIRGSGISTILLAMTCTGWISMARICRGQIFQIKQLDYIAAAKTMGASSLRIIAYHLIPNAIGPIIATMTLTIPGAMFTEAFLSFLGLGIQAPAASLGVMISDGVLAMRYYGWRLLFPSLVLTSLMLSLNGIGNTLRDRIDPRLQQ